MIDTPARLETVHEATTQAEREAIWAFRYRIYVEELGRKLVRADHARQWLRDAEDDKPYTTHLYTADADGITGVLRLRCWAPGKVPDKDFETFSMERFPGIEALATAESGRLMIAPSERGGLLRVALLRAAYEVAIGRHGVELAFLNCAPGLVRHYRKMGLHPYRGRLVATPDGIEVPLVLFATDLETLRGAGSMLLSVAERCLASGGRTSLDVSRFAHLLDGADMPLEVDRAAVWARIEERLRQPVGVRPTLLHALGPEILRKLSGEGLLLFVPATELLTEKGLRQREMFLVLDGLFEALDDGRHLRYVHAGDVIGEMAFLSTSGRRTASVRAVSDGRVLVLRRRFIAELRKHDPDSAAEILFNLARVLADRTGAVS